jgi:hypothetical protein
MSGGSTGMLSERAWKFQLALSLNAQEAVFPGDFSLLKLVASWAV